MRERGADEEKTSFAPSSGQDPDTLERAVRSISERAAKTNDVIDEAIYAGIGADHPVVVAAKMLRLELLKTKAELERGLSDFVLDCTACGQEVHWVQGIGMADPGHWGHRFPAPHGEPAV